MSGADAAKYNIRVTLPDGYVLAKPDEVPTIGRSFGPIPRGPIPMPAGVSAPAGDELVAALESQEMELIHQADIALVPAPATGAAGARMPAMAPVGPGAVSIDLDLELHEDAALLVQADDVYSWHFASDVSVPDAAQRRAAGAGVAKKHVAFRVDVRRPASGTPQSASRGLVTDLGFGAIRTFVLKFAARVAVGQVMKFLERDVRSGLIDLSHGGVSEWSSAPDIAALARPDRPARVLLFVHGTFSSTVGAFGALSMTPWGQAFLDAARAGYDAVWGFDHRTLSEDPLGNATDLLQALKGAGLAAPPQIDAIVHSRGGLVIRSLVEQVLPVSAWKPIIGRVVFVGTPNGGTHLAEPANWNAFIDVYTNLAVAASRLLGLLPCAGPAAGILREIVQGVGAFAKYLATSAISEGGIPGLAAMEPDGAFVRELNRTQPGQPNPTEARYFAVTSEFDSTSDPPAEGGLPKKLLLAIADRFADQLMKVANDLVVDTPSMIAIDPDVGGFVKDSLDFGKNAEVYHLNYFARPEVTAALARWLNVKPRLVAAGSDLARAPRGMQLGVVAQAALPASVDTSFAVVEAHDSVGAAVEIIRQTAPKFLVIRRPYDGQFLHYAFRSDEVMARAADSGASLMQAMQLQEGGASREASSREAWGARVGHPLPSAGRGVVLRSGAPAGVIPMRDDLAKTRDLVAAARAAPPAEETLEEGGGAFEEPSEADEAFDPGTEPIGFESGAGGPPRGTPGRRSFPSPAQGLPPPASPPASAPPPVRAERAAPATNGDAVRVVSPGAPRNRASCHVLAETDAEVAVGAATSVDVTVSREAIANPVERARDLQAVELDVTQKIVLHIVARRGFAMGPKALEEVDAPQPGKPVMVSFPVTARDVGDGEIWVLLFQGAIPLLTLALYPRVVTAAPAVRRREAAETLAGDASALRQPPHMLTILETNVGDDLVYEFLFYSTAVPMPLLASSRPIKGNRQAFVANLYQQIEGFWVSSKRKAGDFAELLRVFGADLLDQLVPRPIQEVLWNFRNVLTQVMILSTEPFIPWELVHLKDPSQATLPDETIFMGQLGVVRWLHNVAWPPEDLRVDGDKAKYVIPAYPHPEYKLPQAQMERPFLEKEFKATAIQPHLTEVREALRTPGAFHLLHFAGHGYADPASMASAEVMLEGFVQGTQYDTETLQATLVEQTARLVGEDGMRPIVVLNACRAGQLQQKLTSIGGFAKAFINRGAGAFVGASWSVGDAPARTFTEALYAALRADHTLAEATIVARNTAKKAEEATWLAYVVYGNPGARLTVGSGKRAIPGQ